jgi:hypothetical protein
MILPEECTYFQPAHQVKKILLILFLVVPLSEGSAAGEQNGRGVKAVALANAFEAIADDPWALYYNAAGLAQIRQFQFSGFLVPSQFGLPELRTTAVACAVPFSGWTAGCAVEQFGFDLYRETSLSLGTGVVLERHVYAGATLHVCRIDIARYGTTSAAGIDIGLLWLCGEQLRIGCTAANILQTTSFPDQEKIPQTFSAGAAYSLLPTVVCTVGIEKDGRFPANLKAGMEQIFLHVLALRVGIAENPGKFSTGFSYSTGWFEFGYAGYSHTELGWTNQIEVKIKP